MEPGTQTGYGYKAPTVSELKNKKMWRKRAPGEYAQRGDWWTGEDEPIMGLAGSVVSGISCGDVYERLTKGVTQATKKAKKYAKKYYIQFACTENEDDTSVKVSEKPEDLQHGAPILEVIPKRLIEVNLVPKVTVL